MAKKRSSAELVSNRRAYHDYEILETFEAGIVLTGAEVKALRNAGGHLQEAYVRVIGRELWLIGASISPYRFGDIREHQETRDRKLLMHRREIQKLQSWTREKGQTLVPLAFYLKEGKVKVRIGRARGKKMFDKRASIKEREMKRRMEQAKKKF